MIAASLCLGLLNTSALADRPAADTVVYIGAHGDEIFGARLDPATGVLTAMGELARVERPTWLVADPQRLLLYSVSETGNDGKSQGGVVSLAIDSATGALKVLSKVESGGGGATHLSYNAKDRSLFVANYGAGQVSAIPVQADGILQSASSTQANVGSGPTPRQQGPHAHSAVVDPTGRFVLSADLGADRIFVYRFDPAAHALSPADPPFLAAAPGSGPRHLVFSPDGHFAFLDTEMSAQLLSFHWDAERGRLTPIQAVDITSPGFQGSKSAAEIGISSDGRSLYASNRGENTLLVYSIDRQSGLLTRVQEIACGGETPWSFGIDPTGRWMIVTNEGSNNLSVFRIDKATGHLQATGNSLSISKPVAIAFHAMQSQP